MILASNLRSMVFDCNLLPWGVGLQLVEILKEFVCSVPADRVLEAFLHANRRFET